MTSPQRELDPSKGSAKKRTPPSWQNLAALLSRAQQGNEECREQVFGFLRARLLVLAKHRISECAEDIVHDALVVVHNHLPEFGTLEGMVAFANKVLRNKIGNAYQSRYRQAPRQATIDESTEPGYQIGDDVQAVELERIIRESIDKLGERHPHCRAILACLYHGLDTGEMVEHLGVSKSQLKVRTFRCRRALREILNRDYGLLF